MVKVWGKVWLDCTFVQIMPLLSFKGAAYPHKPQDYAGLLVLLVLHDLSCGGFTVDPEAEGEDIEFLSGKRAGFAIHVELRSVAASALSCFSSNTLLAKQK